MDRLGPAGRLSRDGAFALMGLLIALLAITLPELGSNPWPFRPGSVEPRGVLGPVVRAAGEEWDVGIARAACFLAALVVVLLATWSLRRRDWPAWGGAALAIFVALALLVPSTLLQVGLRDATAPWFHTNDSTYQIELGGELLLDGENPYGADYRSSGMERFYTRDGSVSERVREREVSLEHYAYFPGTALAGAAWRLVPAPFDDFRVFVLLMTFAGFFAAMAFRAPLSWRLSLGVLIAANPIAVRSAWFGQNDAPSITLMVLAFALVTRGRVRWAAAALAGAVLLKQFAVVAIPFLALMIVKQGVERAELKRCAAVFAAVIAGVSLPFVIADPVAFYEDTVKFGAGTYKIVGYGLSAMLIRAGILEDRDGSYPFALIALITWLPLTAWLCVQAHRAREVWVSAAAFAISLLVLLFIGRTFNNYYLVWPMTGAMVAALVFSSERALASASQARTGTSGPPGTPGPGRR